jgi:hypothetical protein
MSDILKEEKEIFENQIEAKEEGDMSFLDDEEFSAKIENSRLREEITLADARNRRIGYKASSENLADVDCTFLPKIEQIEKSLDSAHEQIRAQFLVLERLKYNFETHTKQIKVLESFIESQNTKNEKIHNEISSLKITVESIQTQTGIILQSIERVNSNFEKHIHDMEEYFLKAASEKHKEAVEKNLEIDRRHKDTTEQLENFQKVMKVGLWIAYSLGAIVIIAGAIHTIFAPESIAQSISSFIFKTFSSTP